jgi:hypothetical protein
MKVNDELWSKHQYQMLVSFVHHLAYSRVLRSLYNELQQKSEFWTRTIDAHLLRAVIDWCMVFGTDSSEIHWKKVIVDKEMQCAFRQRLLKLGKFKSDQWDDYWDDMTTFRNKYAAHRTAEEIYPTTPMMDTAFLVCLTYDHWIRDWLRESQNAVFDEPSLEERYERVTHTSQKLLKPLVELGPTDEQEYEGNVPQ